MSGQGYRNPPIEGDFHAFRRPIQLRCIVFYGIRPVKSSLSRSRNGFVCVAVILINHCGIFTLNFGVATPAAAVDHLFVSRTVLIVRAPVSGEVFLYTGRAYSSLKNFCSPTVVFGVQVAISPAPVIAKPSVLSWFSCTRCCRYVHGAGAVLFITAAPSAGRPKASQADWLQLCVLPSIRW